MDKVNLEKCDVLQCYAFWELKMSRRINIKTKIIKTSRKQQQQQQYLNGNERFVMIHLGNITKAERAGLLK